MLASQNKNELKYNYIDYKQPVNAIENDFRTSTYLGHRNFKQNDSTLPPSTSCIPSAYTLHQKEMSYSYASEQASQFTLKCNFDRTNKANLYMCCSKPAFAKSMEHRIFSCPPKPIRSGSTQSRDYTAKSLTNHNDYVILNTMSCIGNRSGCLSDLDDGGCYKYDSTNLSSFKAPNGEHIPPGCSKNTITFWNYNQPPKFRLSDSPKQKIVGNAPTFLKHSGMKSENQGAYIFPIPKKFNCGGIVVR